MKHRRTKLFFSVFAVLVLIAGAVFLGHQETGSLTPVWAVKVEGAGSGVSVPVLSQEKAGVQPSKPVATTVKTENTPVTGEKPRIAIIIDDMGVNVAASKRAIALPAAVTLSFLPYTSQLKSLSEQARAAGHEILLHIPMEPTGNENPGPDALLTRLKPEEIRARTIKALDTFSGYDGVNNHMGSKFTTSREGMDAMLGVLKERGLFFFDSLTTPGSIAELAARGQQIPVGKRDVFLDNTASVAAIRKQLAELEEVARRNGQATGIGHPKATLVQALATWIPEAEKNGFRVVPVRELVR